MCRFAFSQAADPAARGIGQIGSFATRITRSSGPCGSGKTVTPTCSTLLPLAAQPMGSLALDCVHYRSSHFGSTVLAVLSASGMPEHERPVSVHDQMHLPRRARLATARGRPTGRRLPRVLTWQAPSEYPLHSDSPSGLTTPVTLPRARPAVAAISSRGPRRITKEVDDERCSVDDGIRQSATRSASLPPLGPAAPVDIHGQTAPLRSSTLAQPAGTPDRLFTRLRSRRRRLWLRQRSPPR